MREAAYEALFAQQCNASINSLFRHVQEPHVGRSPQTAGSARDPAQPEQDLKQHSTPTAQRSNGSRKPNQSLLQHSAPTAQQIKGSRELDKLLQAFPAAPLKHTSALLPAEATGRTRAQSALQPGTASAPCGLKEKKPDRELSSLFSDGATVQLKRAHIPVSQMQSRLHTGTGRAPLNPKGKKEKASRELDSLLKAAMGPTPQQASSAMHLQATRNTRAQSTVLPGTTQMPAPASKVQQISEPPLQPKALRVSLRELRALYENAPAPVMHSTAQPEARDALQMRAADAAGPGTVSSVSEAAPGEHRRMAKLKSPCGRERAWAARGAAGQMGSLSIRVRARRAVTAQVGSPIPRLHTRRAAQAASAQRQPVAQRTRKQQQRPGLHLSKPSSLRQFSGKGMPSAQHTARQASRTAVKTAGSAAQARAGQPCGRAGSKAAKKATGVYLATAAPPKRGLVMKRKGRPATRIAARPLPGRLLEGDPAGALRSALQEGVEVPQEGYSALRRTKRSAAGAMLPQLLREARNPLAAARARQQHDCAAQGVGPRRKALDKHHGLQKPGKPPLKTAPKEEAAAPSSGFAENSPVSKRPRREAALGVQRVLNAYKASWRVMVADTGKRGREEAASTWPRKRPHTGQLRRDTAPLQRLMDAAGPMPPGGVGVKTTAGAQEPSAVCRQQPWDFPAAQRPMGAPLRPHQEFTPVQTEPWQKGPRVPGAAALGHAARVRAEGFAPAVNSAPLQQQLRPSLYTYASSKRIGQVGRPPRPLQTGLGAARAQMESQIRQGLQKRAASHEPMRKPGRPAGSGQGSPPSPSALRSGGRVGVVDPAADPESLQSKASPYPMTTLLL